jgi:hypothetical protein
MLLITKTYRKSCWMRSQNRTWFISATRCSNTSQCRFTLEDSRHVKHSKIMKSYRELQQNFNEQTDEAVERLRHHLRRGWNTDAQRIASARGLWRESDWQPIRSWLYDYIVDPLKSDANMPTSIRRLRLRLKEWMHIQSLDNRFELPSELAPTPTSHPKTSPHHNPANI